jgi:hypothetical protein
MALVLDAPPTDVPDGWVVWLEDGRILMEEDPGGSPCSWPIEEGA